MNIYKNIGSIFVRIGKETLRTELREKKENLEMRIKAQERQEHRLLEKLKNMRTKIDHSVASLRDNTRDYDNTLIYK